MYQEKDDDVLVANMVRTKDDVLVATMVRTTNDQEIFPNNLTGKLDFILTNFDF